MKDILLHISDEAYNQLGNEFMIKRVTGNLYTLTDEFMSYLLKSIKEGDSEITLELKKEKKRGKP
jgi:hypothetical protein